MRAARLADHVGLLDVSEGQLRLPAVQLRCLASKAQKRPLDPFGGGAAAFDGGA